MHEERVDDLLGVAVMRKYFMWHARCRACGVVDCRPVTKHQVGPLARGSRARGWFIISWSLLVLTSIVVGVCWLWNERIEHAHALAPIVGDHWTIVADEWPEKFDNPKEYMRVEVTQVSDDTVGLAACDMSYDKSDDARTKCDSFTFKIDGIERAKLAAIYDDVIQRVDSERDNRRPLTVAFGICAALVFVWRIIANAWKRRFSIAEF
jgi:hypothetical protein